MECNIVVKIVFQRIRHLMRLQLHAQKVRQDQREMLMCMHVLTMGGVLMGRGIVDTPARKQIHVIGKLIIGAVAANAGQPVMTEQMLIDVEHMISGM